MTERDYRRLLNLAFDMDDFDAADEALVRAPRRGDHRTGRQLLSRLYRPEMEDLRSWMPYAEALQYVILPDSFEPLEYEGIRLCFGPRLILEMLLHAAERVYPAWERNRFIDTPSVLGAIRVTRRFLEGATLDPGQAYNAGDAAQNASYAMMGYPDPQRRAQAAAMAASSAALAVDNYDSSMMLYLAREGLQWARQAAEDVHAEQAMQEAEFLDGLLGDEGGCCD